MRAAVRGGSLCFGEGRWCRILSWRARLSLPSAPVASAPPLPSLPLPLLTRPSSRTSLSSPLEHTQRLCVLADRDQAFMRLLGLELTATGPPCQRFAGVVDNGTLLRLKVESAPGDLKLTHVQSMLEEFKRFFG